MEHIETRYEVTLRDKEGNEFRHIRARNFDGTFLLGKELWSNTYTGGDECDVRFYEKGNDDQLYKIGCFKVVKMERIDTYEERTEEIL